MPRTAALQPEANPGSVTSGTPWMIQRGEDEVVIVRSVTAGEPEPADWRQRLVTSLHAFGDVTAVGAKRVDADGRLFSMGEFTIHPKGFHHLGRGVDAKAYRFPEEVDAICGGVFAVDEAAFDRARGAELLATPLGCLDLCLTLRINGGRCITIPDVLTTDAFSLLSCPQITPKEIEAFIGRWGFDWRAPDLDAVQAHHGAGGLLWNIRFFGQAMPFSKYEHRPCMHWRSYAEVDVYRQRADALVKMIVQATPAAGAGYTILDLGCGDGLFTHLLARTGHRAAGVDPEPTAVEQAIARSRAEASRGAYPGPPPEFLVGAGESIPFATGSMQTVAMLDVIEHLRNPVAVLGEVRRVLTPGGCLIVSTPAWQYGGWSDPVYHVCEYSLHELVGQIETATHLAVRQTGRIGGPYRDLIVIAAKNRIAERDPSPGGSDFRPAGPTVV